MPGEIENVTGLQFPLKHISYKLAKIIGTKRGEQMSNKQLGVILWAYLLDNNLQDPTDREFFTPDKTMEECFGNTRQRCGKMLTHLRNNVHTADTLQLVESFHPPPKGYPFNTMAKKVEGPTKKRTRFDKKIFHNVFSEEVKTVEEAEAVLAKSKVVVFGFGHQPGHAQAASELRESVLFAHTSAEEVMKKLGHKIGIVLFRPKTMQNKFESSEVIYEGPGPVDKWIKANYHGICGVRTTDNDADFKNPLVTAYYAVDYMKNAEVTNNWRNRVMKIAADFSGFNYAVANKDDFQGELSELGYDYVAGDEPPVVAAKDASGLKYRMDKVANAKEFMLSLKEFLTQLKAGNLEPYHKSVLNNAVKVAVAKNFDHLVMKSEKDVLVEFYAPWCDDCKKLSSVFEELAQKMADEDVEIVKMDATANDVPSKFDVKVFPTLFWLPKGSKKVTSYNGGREINDFVKYIAENASDELKGYDRNSKEKKVEL